MWFTKSQEEVLKELNVDPKIGLTTEEVNKRLEKYGQNKLKGKPKKSLFQLFLGQLQDVLIYVLIGAAVINNNFILIIYIDYKYYRKNI